MPQVSGPADTAVSPATARPEHDVDRSQVRRLLGGFGFLAGANILSQLMGVVTLAYVSHRTTPAQLGAYSFSAALMLYFALGVNFGVTMLAIRDMVREPDRRREIMTETLALQTSLSLVAFLVIVAAAPALAPDPFAERLLPIVGLRVVVDALSLDWALQAEERFRLLAGVRIAGQVVYAVGIFLLVTHGQSAITTYAWLNVVGFVVVTVGARLALGRRVLTREAIRPRLLARRLRRSAPLGASLAMIQIYFSIDAVMLAYFSSSREVGLYAVAYKFPIALGGLASIWASSIFPHAADLARRDVALLARQVGRAATVAAGLGIPILIVTVAVGSEVLGTFFGDAYARAGTVFALLIAATVAILVSINFGNVLLAAGHERSVLVATTAGAVVNVGLNLVLIPRLASLGAGIATLVAETLVMAINIRLFGRGLARPVVPWRLAAVFAVAAAGSALVPVVLSASWLVLTVATLAAYAVLAGGGLLQLRARGGLNGAMP